MTQGPNPEPLAQDVVTDGALVLRVLGGDAGGFEPLMRRHNRRVFRTARAIVRSDHEAEDVVQEAYVRAFTHLAELSDPERFGPWVARIAAHEALARSKQSARLLLVEEAEDTDVMTRTPEREVSDRELVGLVERAIDQLPLALRAAVMLCGVEGMTPQEASEVLAVPAETVRTRLHRGRARIQEQLARDIGPASAAAFSFDGARCDRIVLAVLQRVSAR